MKNISILFVLILFVFFCGVCDAEDDFQYWSQYSVKIVDGEKIDLITFADLRIQEDASKLGLYLLSQRLKMDFWKNLSLGLNYTYLSSRNTKPGAVKDDYNWQHRLELEANPSWNIKDWLKLSVRNRYEFRWIENRGSYNDRFRHRWIAPYARQDHRRQAPVPAVPGLPAGAVCVAAARPRQ